MMYVIVSALRRSRFVFARLALAPLSARLVAMTYIVQSNNSSCEEQFPARSKACTMILPLWSVVYSQ